MKRWVKELEKLTNTDIELTMLPLKDFDSKMTLMFASMIFLTSFRTWEGYKQGNVRFRRSRRIYAA